MDKTLASSNKIHKGMVDHQMWSFLPDDILQKIVTRLNIDEEFLFSVSATSFNVKIVSKTLDIRSILDNLFTIFNSPLITNFSIQIPSTFFKQPRFSTVIDSWVRLLCARNVQHLELKCCFTFDRSLVVYRPRINFSIHSYSLHSLDLDFGCIKLTDRNSITLPNLRKLKLGLVICYRTLEQILRVCPSLESLSLTIGNEPHKKGKNSRVLIASNNLNQLCIVLNSQLMIEVMIDCPQLESFQYESNSMLSTWMLDSISHVKSLIINLGCSIKLYHGLIKTVFPNLTHLKLSVCQSSIFPEICDMVHRFSDLEVLELGPHFCYPKATMIEHVKQVTLYMSTNNVLYDDQDVLTVAKYMLRSAPVLKKLTIDSFSSLDKSFSVKARFYKTLLEYPKASSSCEIQIF